MSEARKIIEAAVRGPRFRAVNDLAQKVNDIKAKLQVTQHELAEVSYFLGTLERQAVDPAAVRGGLASPGDKETVRWLWERFDALSKAVKDGVQVALAMEDSLDNDFGSTVR